jgi:molybdopterin synthase catalytic subunit
LSWRRPTDEELDAPAGADWVAVSERPLPVDVVSNWASVAGCGAVVTFCGTVRNHSEGRPGVIAVEYEAYTEQVVPRMTAIAGAARARWPGVGRLALLHRVGRLEVGDVSVVVVVSTPHRAEAFDAARFCIDTIKTSVPIWKRETWSGGSDWSLCDHPVEDVSTSSGLPPR